MHRPVRIVDYDNVDFYFIDMYYDANLTGFCTYKNKLCRFITICEDLDKYENDDNSWYIRVAVIDLRWYERLYARFDIAVFLLFVNNRHSIKPFSFNNNFRPMWMRNIYYLYLSPALRKFETLTSTGRSDGRIREDRRK